MSRRSPALASSPRNSTAPAKARSRVDSSSTPCAPSADTSGAPVQLPAQAAVSGPHSRLARAASRQDSPPRSADHSGGPPEAPPPARSSPGSGEYSTTTRTSSGSGIWRIQAAMRRSGPEARRGPKRRPPAAPWGWGLSSSSPPPHAAWAAAAGPAHRAAIEARARGSNMRAGRQGTGNSGWSVSSATARGEQ
uniref:Uncharacterized protein n=1 Tax=Human herpesvirus 1 TaxID=10298 RepID=A0A2U9A3N3_HHV1|nr:hypothetical protein [Human alphaherpesvirus 1]QBH86352.1 hypothetical protein [Human alphaherpesvirus 1]QBH86530.1 hypothetical protein [Human alphaherpesvirus 1]